MELGRLEGLPNEDKQERMKILQQKLKNAVVPYDRYPYNLAVKGLGWCQVTIMEDSADL